MLEALEPRLLMTVDIYIGDASVNGFTGEIGSTCSLTIGDFGNYGSTTVPSSQVDVTWFLSTTPDLTGTRYLLWTGIYPYDVWGYGYGGSLTRQATIPNIPQGNYYFIATMNIDDTPMDMDPSDNVMVLMPAAAIWKDDHANSATGATAVIVGLPVAGAIERTIDADWFDVTLQAGHAYTLESIIGTLTDTQITLYSANGTTVLGADDNSGTNHGSKLQVIPATTGHYFIKVANVTGTTYDADRTGSYSLRVNEVAYPGAIVVGGRLLYTDPDGVERPLANVPVRLYDRETAGADELLGSGWTDADGYFTVDADALGNPISNADLLPDLGGRDLYVVALAGNNAAAVSKDWADASQAIVWTVASTVTNNVADGAVNLGDLRLMQSFGQQGKDVGLILGSLQAAQDWLFARAGWLRGPVKVLWPTTAWPVYGSYLNQDRLSSGGIKLPQNLNTYADPHALAVHEYAYAVLYTARGGTMPAGAGPTGTQAAPGGGHYVYSQASPGFAFAEGWARFFAAAVFDDPTAGGLNLESNKYWMGADGKDGSNDDANTGETVEGAVATILWNIYKHEVDLGLNGGFDELWTVLTQDRPDCIWNAAGTNDFYHAWVARYGASDALDQLFLANGIAVRPEYVAPNLAATLGAITLTHTVVPGDKGKAVVVVANNGLARAAGPLTVNVYASADTSVDAGDALLKTVTATINFAPGAGATYTMDLVFGDNMPLGTYYILAELAPGAGIADLVAADNLVASAGTYEGALKFGNFDGRTNVSITVRDAGGTPTTFRLTGAGYGEIAGGSQFTTITFTGTTLASAATFSTAGTGTTASVGDLVIAGSMGSLSAATTRLRGNVGATGRMNTLVLGDLLGGNRLEFNTGLAAADPKTPISMTFGSVADALIDTHGLAVGTLTAIRWLDTDLVNDTLTASALATLAIKGQAASAWLHVPAISGDFEADLILSGAGLPATQATLGAVTVTGNLTGTWTVTGKAGGIVASGTIDGWALTAGAVGGLTLGDVTSATVTSAGALGTVSAKRWLAGSLTGGTASAINAPGGGYGSALKGDWGADVTLTGVGGGGYTGTLGSANITGGITGGTWDITGKAGTLTAVGTINNWTLTADNLGGLTLGDVTLANVTATGTLGTVSAKRWLAGSLTGGTASAINAPGGGYGSALKGDFNANVTLTGVGGGGYTGTLGSANITGGISGGTWDITGKAGTLTAAGTINNWTVTAGSLGGLTLGDVTLANVTSVGPLGTVSAKRWQAGSLAGTMATSIAAPGGGYGSALKGDWGANVTLSGVGVTAYQSTLGTTNITGNVDGAVWAITGKAGGVTVAGTITNWTLGAGSFGGLTLGDVTSANVTAAGALGTVSAKRWMAGSLTGGTASAINAPGGGYGSAMKGDFGADVTITGVGGSAWASPLGGANLTGRILGGTWNVTGAAGAVQAVSAAGWTAAVTGAWAGLTLTGGNLEGTITALSLGKLEVKGDLVNSVVTLSKPVDPKSTYTQTLGTLTVTGWMDNSRVASAGSIGTAKIGGMKNASRLFVGVKPAVAGLPAGRGDFLDGADNLLGSIQTLTITGMTGQAFSVMNSFVAAWTLGTVTLKDVQVDNAAAGHATFGVTGHTLASYTRLTGTATTVTRKNPPAPTVVENPTDFLVQVV